jgi:RimJ/RimL family protein N-acetyltransferase
MSASRAPEIETPRLLLRGWEARDLAPFAALNADPEVMAFFPATLSRAQSDALVERIEAHFRRHPFGLWAVEVKGGAPFIGFVGLQIPGFKAAFTPCVEIGWRLARPHWGRGFASEAAKAALGFGFETCGLDEILAFAVSGNERSRRVMDRIGMRWSPDEGFEHPMLQAGHPLARHVLYRMDREAWAARRPKAEP